MKEKIISIDVVFGGQSPEHDVSIVSAASIINGFIKMSAKYRVYGVYISKQGNWYRSNACFSEPVSPDHLKELLTNGIKVSPSVSVNNPVYHTESEKNLDLPDLFFPVLHGEKGEDGTIQGLFTLMNIPFVGCGVIGGSTGMDKEVMRILFEYYQIPTLPWYSFTKTDWDKDLLKEITAIERKLRYPLFVKPANLGSSIGISKVKNQQELTQAITSALEFDKKVIIEQGENVREIECSVLGNEDVKVSEPGEIIPGDEFYNYNDKYKDNKSELVIPAVISEHQKDQIISFAKTAFRAVNAKGLSRIDFFISKTNDNIYINEINTFPGFTQISMYPKLWEYSGISFEHLLEELIKLAME